MKATMGSNPSFAWRSILWGRNLFKLGYRWRIGNGFSVDALEDPWIPREGAARPIMISPNIRHFTVAQLKDNHGLWNEILIWDSFLEADATTILNIPTSPNMGDDEIIWNYDPRSQFSVKSTYRLGCQINQNSQASPSNHKSQEVFWKSFWKTNLPSKVKICGWKVYNNILPTLDNLTKWGMDVNPICYLCRERPKTTTHLFWQ